MKKFNLPIFCLFIALITSSCYSLHQGNISSNLVESNFTYKESAMGQASSLIIFGIGISKKDDLINQAKQNLESSRFLAPNERYINYVIDKKTSIYFGIVKKQLFTVHADIISINETQDNPMSTEFRENYLRKRTEDAKLLGSIPLGKYWHNVKQYDPIFLSDGRKALIDDLNKNEAKVSYIEGNGYQTKTLKISDIFFVVNSNHFPAVKQEMLPANEQGEVVGFNTEKILIKNGKQNYKIITAPKK
ncbi:hypothetical protein QYS48_27570 [Marivirga arenosa]|uniref:Lipoprotein n=1 Tax=Marivirga arenosa TaxID=3059076 RepID=A0AA51RAQ4_9BACT|nr:DUF6567 family protein [Marivirga sp. ABR2-2]WMN07043.1 hypothetical protein QYS48_27570 [Marivirga sp. ABR2-2]